SAKDDLFIVRVQRDTAAADGTVGIGQLIQRWNIALVGNAPDGEAATAFLISVIPSAASSCAFDCDNVALRRNQAEFPVWPLDDCARFHVSVIRPVEDETSVVAAHRNQVANRIDDDASRALQLRVGPLDDAKGSHVTVGSAWEHQNVFI